MNTDTLERAIADPTDDCVIWTGRLSANGYPRIVGAYAHVVACTIANGPRPDRHDAAHSCGNRACVNPRHLRWATRAENMADAIRHGTTTRGTANWSNRLTEQQVQAIRQARQAGRTTRGLAVEYGVSHGAICGIVYRKTWAWLP